MLSLALIFIAALLAILVLCGVSSRVNLTAVAVVLICIYLALVKLI